MTDIVIACVWTRGSIGNVTRLRDSLQRHLTRDHTLVCLTNAHDRCSGVTFVDINALGLTGWWCKMALFEPLWRGWSKVIFLDLSLNIAGDISPLADVPGEFAIRNGGTSGFQYDSSVMVIGSGMCGFVWDRFDKQRSTLMSRHYHGGDRGVIGELYPSAARLDRTLPKDFFTNVLTKENDHGARAIRGHRVSEG